MKNLFNIYLITYQYYKNLKTFAKFPEKKLHILDAFFFYDNLIYKIIKALCLYSFKKMLKYMNEYGLLEMKIM